jgi:hypothetical protein
MYANVPPRDDPSARPEPNPVQDSPYTLPANRVSLVSSDRATVVVFALVGGGLTSMACGLLFGTLAWATTPNDFFALSAPSMVRQTLAAQVVNTTITFAPYLFLVFALAAAAQILAGSYLRGSTRVGRALKEAQEPAPRDRPRSRSDEGRPPAGSASHIVRPLLGDRHLEIDPREPEPSEGG